MNVDDSLKEYTVVLKKSTGQYVALSLENMVVGCGNTKDETIRIIKDAISSYLDSAEDRMPMERPIPLNLLHEFLSEETKEVSKPEVTPRLRLLIPEDVPSKSRSEMMNLEQD